jgi:hypothetical protein
MKGAHRGRGECGGDGNDLNWFGLLRCQGGGPLEAVEDEGLSVLLGSRSRAKRWRQMGGGGVSRRQLHANAGDKKKERGGANSGVGKMEKRGVRLQRPVEEGEGGRGLQTHFNRTDFIRSKDGLPELKIFKKNGCKGIKIRNNFPYWNFSKFGLEFELQIRKGSRCLNSSEI